MKKKEIFKLFVKKFSEIVKEYDVYKTGRKNSENIEEYVTKIANVLFYNHSWESFDNTTKYRKKYNKWTKDGLIDILYHKLYEYYCKKRTFKELYVDSKVVQNFNCHDDFIKHYYKIKSKKQIKMHAISDNNNILHGLIFTPPAVHDVTMIPYLVKNTNCNLHKNSYVVGDKGYITPDNLYKKKQNGKNKQVLIVSPIKSNQTNKRLNNIKKNLLKKRFKAEQTFAHMTRTYQRLDKLYEKSLNGYSNMIKLSQICQILRKTNPE